MRGAAVGLLALLRNEGGSVGTSVAQIVQQRREQFHILRLNESLDALNPAVHHLLAQGQAFFLQHTGDASLSHQNGAAGCSTICGHGRRRRWPTSTSSRSRRRSAWRWSWFVLLMRRSVAEKGAHIGAE